MTAISTSARLETQLADAAAPRLSSARPDDELLPFLNNFHDIFTTIGVLILFVGLAIGAGQVFDMTGADPETLSGELVVLCLLAGIGAAAWLLSAVLVGKQRRILPGIVLSVVFVGCAGAVLTWLYARATFGMTDPDEIGAVFEGLSEINEPTRAALGAAMNDLPVLARLFPAGLGLIFSAVIAAYYFTFRLPFAAGLLGVALVTTAFAALAVLDPYTAFVWNPVVSLASGLALFLAGIVFDARDPERQTRLSGAGFWLHFFAAPTLLGAAVTIGNVGLSLDEADFATGGVFGALGPMMSGDEAAAARNAAVTLAVIAVFAVVSLLINRRALIVAGLITAGVAIGVLVNQAGLGQAAVIAVTLLLLGGVVVLLGAAWTPVRRVLTAPFPNSGPLARIFPPANSAQEG
jgi:hypothetical protein